MILFILIIAASTLLYKFRLRLSLKYRKNTTAVRQSKDLEDQAEQRKPVAVDEGSFQQGIALQPVHTQASESESESGQGKMPVQRLSDDAYRAQRKRRRQSSAFVGTKAFVSPPFCPEDDRSPYEMQDFDIVAWWQSVYELEGSVQKTSI